jgi:hypothetical protein
MSWLCWQSGLVQHVLWKLLSCRSMYLFQQPTDPLFLEKTFVPAARMHLVGDLQGEVFYSRIGHAFGWGLACAWPPITTLDISLSDQQRRLRRKGE